MDAGRIDDVSQHIEHILDRELPAAASEPTALHRAMRYAVLGHGKRIRPRLIYATGAVLGLSAAQLDAPACAVELIHAYSLIHDDLPAMDDDNLRRGKPTTHVAFDEATAILAGDALQALAFEVMASGSGTGDLAVIRARQMATLTRACGSNGMVGGQALDIASEGRSIGLDMLEQIHRMKTGELLRACVLLAADCRFDLPDAEHRALDDFGGYIGLAFQVRDDVLDVEATTEQLGKTQGADIAHHKATYPALLGLEAAKAHAEHLYTAALEALAPFGDRAGPLRDIARVIVKRDH